MGGARIVQKTLNNYHVFGSRFPVGDGLWFFPSYVTAAESYDTVQLQYLFSRVKVTGEVGSDGRYDGDAPLRTWPNYNWNC